jgi:hypothetical protein
MDAGGDRNLMMIWKVKKGDLVKVRELPLMYNSEDEATYSQGIVVSDIVKEDSEQQPLWPYVKVYILHTAEVRECGPAAIEIISNS